MCVVLSYNILYIYSSNKQIIKKPQTMCTIWIQIVICSCLISKDHGECKCEQRPERWKREKKSASISNWLLANMKWLQICVFTERHSVSCMNEF